MSPLKLTTRAFIRIAMELVRTTFSKEEIMKRYGHRDWGLIAGVSFDYPSEKIIGKKGPPRLPVDDVAEFLG